MKRRRHTLVGLAIENKFDGITWFQFQNEAGQVKEWGMQGKEAKSRLRMMMNSHGPTRIEVRNYDLCISIARAKWAWLISNEWTTACGSFDPVVELAKPPKHFFMGRPNQQ